MTAASPPPLPSKIKPETGQCNGRLILPFVLRGSQCMWEAPQGVSSLGSSAWCDGGYSHPVQATWLPVCVGCTTPCCRPSREKRGSVPKGSIARRRHCWDPGRPPLPWCQGGDPPRLERAKEAMRQADHPVESSTPGKLVDTSLSSQVEPVDSSPLSQVCQVEHTRQIDASVRLKARDFKLLKDF
jgi:hypothetical protein